MMQENNKLSQEAMTILYGSSLYQIEEKNTKPLPTAINTHKKIIVLTSIDTTISTNASQLTLLNSILIACKINQDDVKIVHFVKEKTDYKSISNQFKPSFVLLFGTTPTEFGLPLMFPYFQLQLFDNITYISSPALDRIENDKPQKINLWNALKQAFSL